VRGGQAPSLCTKEGVLNDLKQAIRTRLYQLVENVRIVDQIIEQFDSHDVGPIDLARALVRIDQLADGMEELLEALRQTAGATELPEDLKDGNDLLAKIVNDLNPAAKRRRIPNGQKRGHG
jgi:hypothetical protein